MTGDEAAVRILLGGGTEAEKPARLTELAMTFGAITRGTVACPDCEHEGPHDSQLYDGEIEFCCAGCRLQFPAPEVTL